MCKNGTHLVFPHYIFSKNREKVANLGMLSIRNERKKEMGKPHFVTIYKAKKKEKGRWRALITNKKFLETSAF